MAPTYSKGNSDDGTQEGVTFSAGTSSSTESGVCFSLDVKDGVIPYSLGSVTGATEPVEKMTADAQQLEVEGKLEDKIEYNNKGYRKIILLSRHGESENNFSGKIGGDTNLSPRGRAYAGALASYVNSLDFQHPVEVWTSGLKRTIATAAGVKCNQRKAMKELNELHAGCCEGLSYEEIQKKYPMEFAMRDQNKLAYRYPNGESYEDVLDRVDSVIEKLEEANDENENEQKVRLIVSHQAVIRCMLSRIMGICTKELPYIEVPLHTVLWLIQDDSGKWTLSQVRLPVECVNTFRPRPKNCTLLRSERDALETVPTHY